MKNVISIIAEKELVPFSFYMQTMKLKGIKKAHTHTKKDTLQRHVADLYVKQALKYTSFSDIKNKNIFSPYVIDN